ncbi:MAG: radical SAM protein [Deltaproteobacteria bacterium]|nr:radical SAM protein [Deltaproteobacteria bacterium]
MVGAGLALAGRRLREDLAGFGRALGLGRAAPPPRLRVYRRERHGGHTTLHLRRQSGGGALLFVDAMEVIHLSPTAAHLASLVLEEVPEAAALAELRRSWRGAPGARLRDDLHAMRARLEQLSDPRTACRTCDLPAERLPVFGQRGDAPYKADLALTYACNNGCPHCYNDPAHFDRPPLSAARWCELVDRLAEVGVPHLILTGGEATLHPGLVEIVAHAHHRGLLVGLNTNGRRLGSGAAGRALARELAAAGLDHVQVTLESHRPEVHDAMVGARAFEQTVAGVEAALAAGLSVLTNTTLTRANARELPETLDFLAGLGLQAVALNAIIHAGGGSANPDALPAGALAPILVEARERSRGLGLRLLWYTVTDYCELSPVELELGPKRCNAGEYSVCLEPDGEVLPCQSYPASAGNLLHTEWETIWESELFRSFRERELDPGRLPEKCRGCPDLSLCGGGCRLEHEARSRGETSEACAGCGGRSSGASALVQLAAPGGGRWG